MKIAIIGAGAIGALAAGYLSRAGVDASLVARSRDAAVIAENGLLISGVRGEMTVPVPVSDRLDSGADVIVLAVKTQDIADTLKENAAALGDAPVITVQNGVRAEEIVKGAVPADRVIGSVVLFGATYLKAGKVVHNFEGDWLMGKAFADNNDDMAAVEKLLKQSFPVRVVGDIKGMKWLKLFLNLNNCLPALIGKSMQETFANLSICGLSIRLLGEALGVVDRAGVVLSSLPDFPTDRLRGLTEMPLEQASRVFSETMTNLSKEPLYGSILQSIKRGKPSEIDYFNGEIVRLGREIGAEAPLNRKMVEMVHKVEDGGGFSRPEEILSEVGG